MRPFESIKIIDVTHVLAGPFAAYQLALLGADVIKVEHPRDYDQSRDSGGDRALNLVLAQLHPRERVVRRWALHGGHERRRGHEAPRILAPAREPVPQWLHPNIPAPPSSRASAAAMEPSSASASRAFRAKWCSPRPREAT